MIFVIPKENVVFQLLKQLSFFFVLSEEEKNEVAEKSDSAFKLCEECFQVSDNKYFTREGHAQFNACHAVQYMIFLYFLSHILYKENKIPNLCDKVYYLNKIMHSVDLFYAIELPVHFGAEHPLGAVMGRAIYGNGFFFYQNCTVGGTKDRDGNISYPVIGENVHMFAGSSILGKCIIGNNVNIGAGAIVKNQNIPSNCTVFGESPNLIIKQNKI